jgi:CrcB protein
VARFRLYRKFSMGGFISLRDPDCQRQRLIGVLAGILGDSGVLDAPQGVRTLLIVGFLGGFTTFSAFSIQTLDLARSSAWLSACMNIILHVSLGLFAVWLGSATAQWLNGQTFK